MSVEQITVKTLSSLTTPLQGEKRKALQLVRKATERSRQESRRAERYRKRWTDRVSNWLDDYILLSREVAQ